MRMLHGLKTESEISPGFEGAESSQFFVTGNLQLTGIAICQTCFGFVVVLAPVDMAAKPGAQMQL
jgi:hypothetical protein